MDCEVDSDLKKKKRYKPPLFRRVRLEVRTSVLSVCSLSVPTSPTFIPATCTSGLEPCQFSS
jgi:hypothetical protein